MLVKGMFLLLVPAAAGGMRQGNRCRAILTAGHLDIRPVRGYASGKRWNWPDQLTNFEEFHIQRRHVKERRMPHCGRRPA
jgi:hypothetical protein